MAHRRQLQLAAALVAALARAPGASAQRPDPPVWPPAFSVAFNETTWLFQSYNFSGVWYYDYANGRQRIDRSTGAHDRYCGTIVTAEDAPCSHLVVDAVRYLVWPTLSKCCGCCNATAGCGVVKPTWMRDAGGSFAGTEPFSGPAWSGEADSWEVSGAQPNYWFQIAGTSTPVALLQIPDDYQYFQPETYAVGPQPDALFALPSYCEPTCGGAGICSIA